MVVFQRIALDRSREEEVENCCLQDGVDESISILYLCSHIQRHGVVCERLDAGYSHMYSQPNSTSRYHLE